MQTLDVARRRFLLAIFVVSGFTGLIYESIWSHYLKLFLGHAAYAQSLVLAIFMGGMALGSWVIAHCSFRIQAAVAGLRPGRGTDRRAGPDLSSHLHRGLGFLVRRGHTRASLGVWIHAYKWSLGSLLIFPQSVLLGMTFPLISGGLIRRWPDRPGETLATLYFTNSLGAAIGVLVSGFVLIEAVGLPGTIRDRGNSQYRARAGDLGAVRGARGARCPRRRRRRVRYPSQDRLGPLAHTRGIPHRRRLVHVRARLDPDAEPGARQLDPFVRADAERVHLRPRLRRTSTCGGASSASAIRSAYVACVMVPWARWRRSPAGLQPDLRFHGVVPAGPSRAPRSGYVGFNVISQLIAALDHDPGDASVPGMTLPLLTRELMRRGAGERAIGTIYSANTFGAIVGVLLTIHVLMPRIGVKGVILGGAAIHIALGLSRLLSRAGPDVPAAGGDRRSASRCSRWSLFAVTSGSAADDLRGVSHRVGDAAGGRDRRLSAGRQDRDHQPGREGRHGDHRHQRQAGRRHSDGARGGDGRREHHGARRRHPAEHAAASERASPTSGSARDSRRIRCSTSDSVERLDSIEIEPFMVEAARRGFGPRITMSSRIRAATSSYEDAKTFFASSREPYDLIVSEPSNPWVSGVATLFSDEFYGRITHYLTPDGYFAQWMQVYETNLGDPGLGHQGTRPAFRRLRALQRRRSGCSDRCDHAAPRSGTPDDRLLQSPAAARRARAHRRSVGRGHQARKIGDNRTLGPVLEAVAVPANSDFYPFVDLNAPRLRYLRDNAMELPALTRAAHSVPGADRRGRAARRHPRALGRAAAWSAIVSCNGLSTSAAH